MGATNKKRRDLKLELLAFELTERRFALGYRAILLVVIVASTTAAVICALRGHTWQTSSTISGPGFACGIALAAEARHTIKRRR
jgi:hypothetical protein